MPDKASPASVCAFFLVLNVAQPPDQFFLGEPTILELRPAKLQDPPRMRNCPEYLTLSTLLRFACEHTATGCMFAV